jgi:hypothetical protein
MVRVDIPGGQSDGVTGHPATEKHNMDMRNIAARISAALADANILAVYHGDGVFSCGDTATDHTSTEVAYAEVMVIIGEDGEGRAVSVGVVWRDDEGGIVDADDEGFEPDDLDGIVSEVFRLRGGAA